MKVHKLDHKYVPKDPEKGFSADRNNKIIDEVIEESERIWQAKRREHNAQLAERTDAVATYLTSIAQGGKTTSIEKYFGKKHLAYLRGQEIISKIQKSLSVVKGGKIIKRAGD